MATARTRMMTTGMAALAALAAAATPLLPGTASAAVAARTLYVSATGNDAADGLSAATAWRSVDRVTREVLAPGDRALFQGGATFTGMLYLDAADAGDASRPVIIGSYGTGRATLASTGNSSIFVYDTAGLEVRNLVVKGNSAAYRSKGGISFYNDLSGDRKLGHLVVTGVDVSGFKNGVEVGGGRGASGFADVSISAATLHDNMETGFATYGPAFNASAPTYAHQGVRVSGVAAYRNVGDPTNTWRNTGSGIILGSVRGGTIQRSRAYENGSACTAPEGPVGIWAYDSDQVLIQRNVSHHNRTGGPADGDGFDLDQNVSGSTLQYNLSYGNDGAGYLVYTGKTNSAHRGNVVRFNLSSNDARKSAAYGGITVWGQILNTEVYNNTVVMQPNASGRPAPLKLDGALSQVAVRNNIFLSDGAGPTVLSPNLGTGSVVLQGNDYAATSATGWQVLWGGKSYTSLSSWRSATKQEYVGSQATGSAADPQLVDFRTALTVTDPADTAGAKGLSLQTTSPLLSSGLDLSSLFGVNAGPADYFRNAVSAGSSSDVGAHHPAM